VARTRWLALTLALTMTACTAGGGGTGGSGPEGPSSSPPTALPGDLVLASSLVAFDACDDFLAYVQEQALEIVTPYGIEGGGGWYGADMMVDEGEMEDAAGDADGAVAASEPGTEREFVEGEDYSGTNVQEQGVDEPDHVKTDGRTLYVVTEGQLNVLDVTGETPELLTTVPLRDAWDAQLLLDGDRLLVTSSAYGAIPFEGERVAGDVLPIPGWGGVTSVTLLDVSDPSDPVAVERLTVDGATLSSRLVDGVARVVVRTEQGNLPWVYPQGSGIRAERTALEANREVIRDSVAEDWIPWFVHETADGDETEGPLLTCDRITHPQDFAGLGVLTVLTVDLEGGELRPGPEALGVLAGGDTVYASPDTLYVATTQWVDWEGMSERARNRRADEMTTEIHAFDISDPRTVGYLGAGVVPGTLLNQWAMSEYEGVLRVASTIGDPWGWGGGSRPSESAVTTLALEDDALVTLGQVTGLGLTERIYSVRFIGDIGYVVTFRETDPLYTLDLSDPSDPTVVGELKILGYSAYLHPMGDDLLLGVGQDADLQGQTQGTQLSLFDVSDLSDPQRIDQVTLSDGSSEVEYDHRAFLHWPATGLTVVPYSRWRWDEETGNEDVQMGAVAFTATRDGGLERLGLLSHRDWMKQAWVEQYGEDWLEEFAPDEAGEDWLEDTEAASTDDVPADDDVTDEAPEDDADEWIDDAEVAFDEPGGWSVEAGRWWDWNYWTQLRRSVVIGDRLLTVSDLGVGSHDLETLADLGWAAFDR
jgi:uncharacterized secreted protein with C-terminal beta-propeller domain